MYIEYIYNFVRRLNLKSNQFLKSSHIGIVQLSILDFVFKSKLKLKFFYCLIYEYTIKKTKKKHNYSIRKKARKTTT